MYVHACWIQVQGQTIALPVATTPQHELDQVLAVIAHLLASNETATCQAFVNGALYWLLGLEILPYCLHAEWLLGALCGHIMVQERLRGGSQVHCCQLDSWILDKCCCMDYVIYEPWAIQAHRCA